MAETLAAITMVTKPTTDALARLQRDVQSANVKAVRAAGLALAAEARRRAPVYQGPRKDVPKGALRRGIKAGKVRRLANSAASVKVGPRGARVHLYAGKIEELEPYMRTSYTEVASALAVIAGKAYIEAMAKAAR